MASSRQIVTNSPLFQEILPMTDDTSSPERIARGLLDRVGKASLATLHPQKCRPYTSLVLIAPDQDGSPVMMLSDLADHAKNLAAEGAASLLLDGTSGAESLSGPRVSMEGEILRVEAAAEIERLKSLFVARHDEARIYAQFSDFRMYKMQVNRLHLIAGFGQIHWLAAEDVLG